MFKLSSFLFENAISVEQQKIENVVVDFVEELQGKLGEQLAYAIDPPWTDKNDNRISGVTISNPEEKIEIFLQIRKEPSGETYFWPDNEKAFQKAYDQLKALFYGSRKKEIAFDKSEIWFNEVFPKLKEKGFEVDFLSAPRGVSPFMIFGVYDNKKIKGERNRVECKYSTQTKILKIETPFFSLKPLGSFNILEDLQGDPGIIASTIVKFLK